MKRKMTMFIELGAAATMLATLFALSACQTTGSAAREDKTMMMQDGMMGEKDAQTCNCAEGDNVCDCKLGKCGGSCGGEGFEEVDSEAMYEEN
jgi:hypothetical protein